MLATGENQGRFAVIGCLIRIYMGGNMTTRQRFISHWLAIISSMIALGACHYHVTMDDYSTFYFVIYLFYLETGYFYLWPPLNGMHNKCIFSLLCLIRILDSASVFL